MSYRHTNQRKARKAARDLLNQGATMAQLDRLLLWRLVGTRVYDQLINPLLDQPEGRTAGRKRIRSVPFPVYMKESGAHDGR